MQTRNKYAAIVLSLVFVSISCQKSNSKSEAQMAVSTSLATASATGNDIPGFNLEVILRGSDNGFGHVKFRQDSDPDKIITLDTWVRNLQPNHSYLLQRAVDTQIDGNCTGTAWLTLGKGLQPQSIDTDETGTGRASLYRDVSAIASGTAFDIHFQVIDAVTKQVILSSDCYTYYVR